MKSNSSRIKNNRFTSQKSNFRFIISTFLIEVNISFFDHYVSQLDRGPNDAISITSSDLYTRKIFEPFILNMVFGINLLSLLVRIFDILRNLLEILLSETIKKVSKFILKPNNFLFNLLIWDCKYLMCMRMSIISSFKRRFL